MREREEMRNSDQILAALRQLVRAIDIYRVALEGIAPEIHEAVRRAKVALAKSE